MRHAFLSLIFGLLIMANSLPAQPNSSCLVGMELNDTVDLNAFEKLQIPIYFQSDRTLVGVLSVNQLNAIRSSDLPYHILDCPAALDQYSLISRRDRQLLVSSPSWGEILWENGAAAIVKNFRLPETELFAAGYMIGPLPQDPFYLKNEKIYPSDQLNFPGQQSVINLLAEINADSVRYFIQSLQNFGTRFLFAPTRDSVAQWIKNQFLRFGISDVYIDSFLYQSTWQKNVIATIPGTVNPTKVFIIGGHHDSYSSGSPMTYAPGADDNASGTAAALETARAMRATGYQPESTIKFITFAAEEYGLHGSRDYARKARQYEMNIGLMINHDMISYTTGTPGNWRVSFNYYSGYLHFLSLATQLTTTYTTLLPRNGTLNASFSDSYSFWSEGFPAIYYEEDDFSPYYHSPNDVISNYNMNYCAEVIRASGALLAISSAIPPIVENFRLFDRGDGSSLLLSWEENSEPDMGHYNIYVGTTSGIYNSVIPVLHSPFVLSGLTEGVTYFVGISAVDTVGNESSIVERSAEPRSIPLAPRDLVDLPRLGSIGLLWRPNTELDLQGYNIYRAEDAQGVYLKLNPAVIPDTAFTDNSTQSGAYYFYTVRAVDNQLNESEPGDTVKSRMVSLDGGILLVDETADGNGSLFNPTDQQVDSFYTDLFAGFEFTHFDLLPEGGIRLADIGAYSTVVWHNDDFTEFLVNEQIRQSLAAYLDWGGNLLVSSFQPARSFAGNVTYPSSFNPGEFIYDYLKISQTEFHPSARFSGAVPLNPGYDSIRVDPAKTSATLNYHLLKVESVSAAPQAQNIFSYDSEYDATSAYGALKGKPVAVEYPGTDFKVIVLSFPLFYMDYLQARQLVQVIMTQRFNELLPVQARSNEVPPTFELFPNYPNPFNPATVIRYALPHTSPVKVRIFDLLGKEVRSLREEVQTAGNYQVSWDGRDNNGALVASGIYIYQVQAGSFLKSAKMILMK